MDKKDIARINELAKKNKAIGLTNEEIKEQSLLRSKYLDDFRKYFRGILDNTKIQDSDGTIRPLK